MPGDVEIQFNENFFVELGRNPRLKGELDAAAQRIMDTAIATAPYGTGHNHAAGTEHYRDSFHLETGARAGRNVTLVVNDDPKALIIEARRQTMARAMLASKQRRS